MSGETRQQVSGWTIETLRIHHEALREGDAKFEQERDRRYAEVATEREKALKIKETADLAALSLARDIQIYKDEKANELRSQIERERGSYATKDDLAAAVGKLEVTLTPLLQALASTKGRNEGFGVSANVMAFLLTSLLTVVGLVLAVYFATH